MKLVMDRKKSRMTPTNMASVLSLLTLSLLSSFFSYR